MRLLLTIYRDQYSIQDRRQPHSIRLYTSRITDLHPLHTSIHNNSLLADWYLNYIDSDPVIDVYKLNGIPFFWAFSIPQHTSLSTKELAPSKQTKVLANNFSST